MNNYTQITLDPQGKVYISNKILYGKSKLTLNALKIIRIVIMQINNGDTEFKHYILKVPELKAYLGIKDAIYKMLSDISVELSAGKVDFYNKNEKNLICTIPWCDECIYDSTTGNFKIRLHDDLKPYLLGLDNNYTVYNIKNILNMKNLYTIKLYELIKCNKLTDNNEHELIIYNSDILNYVIGDNKFENDLDVKKRVIEKSLDEINDITNSHITFEVYKLSDTHKTSYYKFFNIDNI